MKLPLPQSAKRTAPMALAICVLIAFATSTLPAQSDAQNASGPADVLTSALSAACRQDQQAFASFLTADNAAAFRALPEEQRSAFVKRFVLLDHPGKPLLSTSSEGHTVVRCETPQVVSEFRFGATELRDNLAFIPVDVPPNPLMRPQPGQAPAATQSIRFGLVREDGQWKLVSLGLLLLDVPEIARGWNASDREAREQAAATALHTIATALKTYQEAFAHLPESLAQLGPGPGGDISPDHAGLLDAALAMGENDGYQFRYTIVPAAVDDDAERDKTSGFALAATPLQYGKDGTLSLYLDTSGVLRGGDKHGAVATVTDPRISEMETLEP